MMQKKYANWTELVIEPLSMNDARLFALENRLQKEEDLRIKEYDHLRDKIKKLVYVLEQDTKSL